MPITEAFTHDDLGYADDGIQHLTIRFGFADEPNIPNALNAARAHNVLDRTLGQAQPVSYFVSRGAIGATGTGGMARWRKQLFIAMSHNAANPIARFGLPPDRTVTMGSDITI